MKQNCGLDSSPYRRSKKLIGQYDIRNAAGFSDFLQPQAPLSLVAQVHLLLKFIPCKATPIKNFPLSHSLPQL